MQYHGVIGMLVCELVVLILELRIYLILIDKNLLQYEEITGGWKLRMLSYLHIELWLAVLPRLSADACHI